MGNSSIWKILFIVIIIIFCIVLFSMFRNKPKYTDFYYQTIHTGNISNADEYTIISSLDDFTNYLNSSPKETEIEEQADLSIFTEDFFKTRGFSYNIYSK